MTMPVQSLRAQSLQFLEPLILALVPHRHRQSTHRRLHLLAAIYRHIASNRYWDRYPKVNPSIHHPSFYFHPIQAFLERGARHQQAFRMSHSQLVRLVAYFEDDVIFQSQNRKPQACPLYQLGVFIYRMAHGHPLERHRAHISSFQSVVPVRSRPLPVKLI